MLFRNVHFANEITSFVWPISSTEPIVEITAESIGETIHYNKFKQIVLLL